MKEAVIEAVKEALRLVLLAIIPLVIAGLEAGAVDWKAVGIIAGVTALRFVDKLLHEWGKDADNELLTKGLTRF